MNLSRRTLLASTGLAGTAALLTACSGQSGSAAGDITVWNSFQDKAQETYFRNKILAAYPDRSKVTMVVKPQAQAAQVQQTALAAGAGPDIVATAGPSTGVTEFVKAGYLLSLDEYIEQYGWDTKFAAWAVEASKLDGKLRTLPSSYESLVYYTNPATLAKLGASAAPTTRDEFEAYNTEAKGRGIIPIAAGNGEYKGVNEWHLSFALNHAAGPEALYSALTGETKWTDAAFVDAVTLLKTWFQKGWFGGSVESYFTNKFATIYTQLANGKAASMISGSWEFSALPAFFGSAAGNDAKWDWATLPSLNSTVPKDLYALGIGASVGINGKTKSADEAAKYLDFTLTDVKTTVAAIKAVNAQPAPIKLAVSDFAAGTDERLTRFYSELSSTTNIGYTPWTFFPQQTETYLIDYWEQVITNKLTPAAFCAGLQAKFEPELKAGKVPTAPKPGAALQS